MLIQTNRSVFLFEFLSRETLTSSVLLPWRTVLLYGFVWSTLINRTPTKTNELLCMLTLAPTGSDSEHCTAAFSVN